MKTQHQQSHDANASRVFGWQSGTCSNSVLHFLRVRPGQSFSAAELAEELQLSVSRVSSALVDGKRLGVFAGRRDAVRCRRSVFYSFAAMPTAVAPKRQQGGKRHDWAMSEILATRAIQREEVAALRKSNAAKADVIIPEGLQIKVAPARPEMGNRAYVAPDTRITGGFASLRPGQYAFEPASCAALAVA